MESLLTYADVVRAVEDAFRPTAATGCSCRPRRSCGWSRPGQLHFRHARLPGKPERLRRKWTNFYPAQPDGYPTIWAHVLVLSRMDNGMPYAILDATAITNMRTAGGHAVVAAKHLARKGRQDPGRSGLRGPGTLRRPLLRRAFRPGAHHRLQRHPAKLEQYVRETEGTLRARLEIAQSPRDLAERSDILLTATTCRTPLIRAEWLPEGAWWTQCSPLTTLSPISAASATSGWWATGIRPHRDS